MRLKPGPLKWFISLGLLLTLLLAGSLNTMTSGFTLRHIPPDIVVSIQVKNQLLEDVMANIAAKTGLNFHYDKTDLNLKKRVTLHCTKTPIDEVLALLSTQTGLTFTRKNNKIIVGAESQSSTVTSVSLNNSASLERNITGVVRDIKGTPLPGVTILVKNTNKGTKTNAEAGFTIKAGPSDMLIFSSVGFFSREITVGVHQQMDVTLEENVQALSELVVTALGIRKNTKELPYATQQIDGEELTRVKDANVMNTICGKAAGVTINRSASGIGGSVRVVLRGNKSTRENQPLYIIDGVPLANFTPAQPTDVWGQSNNIIGFGGTDGGDGISNINPDDIESINILKGASAAALYGSQAANGVILITTKKGKPGKGHIEVTSDFTIEAPSLLPKLQYRYGQTKPPQVAPSGKPQPGTTSSWGSPVNAPDHVTPFYNTGSTWTNTLAFSGGTEVAQTYFSYSNTRSKGILPTNKFDRHTLNFRETLKLLDDRLQVDANISFLAQNTTNRMASGLYFSPLSGLYNFPRGLNFEHFKNNYEYLDPRRQLYLQNWWNIRSDNEWIGLDDQQNPMWVLHRNQRRDQRYRGMASLALNLRLLPWLSLQTRGSFDKSLDHNDLRAYAGTQRVLATSNGRYTQEKEINTQLYADFIVNMSRQLSKNWHLAGNIGASIQDIKAHDRTFEGSNPTAEPGLVYPNKFSTGNIDRSSLDAQQSIEQKQLHALFANTQLAYRNFLFLDITGRNDWSSTFAYTPTMKKGYFYYSAGVSAVFSDMFKLPAFISFARGRVSYARVGNDIASYAARPSIFTMQTIAGITQAVLNTKAPIPGVDLAPEDNRSFEVGLELRLLQNRVSMDVTFYKNNNYKQYMEVPAPPGSGFQTYYMNLGNIRNQGVEAMITVTPVRNKRFQWSSTVNYAFNRNTIVKLSDNTIPGADASNYFILTDFGVNMFGSFIKEGGSWGDIYSNKELIRDAKGRYVVDQKGKLKTTSTFKKVGNPNPDFTLGWKNTIDCRNFTLSFLIDGRFGGKVMSVTQSVLDGYGVSEQSAAARDNEGIALPAVYDDGRPYTGRINAESYYTAIGGRAGIGEMYMYDATNIRLRELSLSYNVPIRWKWVKQLRAGLIARNLFFFRLSAPFDPEVSMSAGNGLQGVDVFGLPPTRSMGMNLRVSF